MWDAKREEIDQFILEANSPPSISEKEINFLDTTIFKGEGLCKNSVLDVCTHFKPTETFQYTHFTSCHAPGVKKGFIKGEALRLLKTNSSKKLYEDIIKKFKTRFRERGYPDNLINNVLREIRFKERKSALREEQKMRKDILPFVTQYNPAVPNLKNILMSKWHLIENQPSLREIYQAQPIISYKRGKSLKDILVRAKL